MGNEHARKKKVWRGNTGEERRLYSLLVWGREEGRNPQLFAIITCFDGKSCLYPQNRIIPESGARLCRFLFFLQHGMGH